jgi:hypothetical protein
MAMSAQVARWSGRKLYPLKAPHLAQRRTINLPPNVEYDAGQIVSLAGAAANDVQTISDTGTITAGTFTISGQNPITGAAFTTGTIAYNANNAAVKAALEAVLLTGITVTVAGSGLPGSDTTLTFSGSTAGRPVPLMTINSTGLTGGTLAVAHTTPGRTDAFGNVFHADAPAGLGGEATTTMYYSGTFATEDVTGLTTDALAALGGFLVAGSINGPGEFRF